MGRMTAKERSEVVFECSVVSLTAAHHLHFVTAVVMCGF